MNLEVLNEVFDIGFRPGRSRSGILNSFPLRFGERRVILLALSGTSSINEFRDCLIIVSAI